MKNKDSFKTDKPLYNYSIAYDYSHLSKNLIEIIKELEYYDKCDEKLISIYNDERKFKQSIYESAVTIYTLNYKRLNPLKYVESMSNDECIKTVLRVV